MKKKLKILCCECRTHLYWYSGGFEDGSPILPRDFEPASSGIPKPSYGEAMMCVKCGAAFYMVTHRGSILVLTNEGVKPRAPEGTPRVFTPDNVGYLRPSPSPEFKDGEATEFKEIH